MLNIFKSKQLAAAPPVQAVEFTTNGESFELNFITTTTTLPPESFVLQVPYEYIVCVRYHVSMDTGVLLAAQVQTNLGRRSKFHLNPNQRQHAVQRFEKYASQPQTAICGFLPNPTATDKYEAQTCPVPRIPRKKLRQLLLLSSVRKLVLQSSSKDKPSMLKQVMHGGTKSVAARAVSHGLASKMFSVGEDGDALIRLMLDGEDKKPTLDVDDYQVEFPTSIIRALAETVAFEHTLLELMCLGDGKDRVPLIQLLFATGANGSVAKLLFARPNKHTASLAQLTLTPNRTRGLRSIMQLMTDDEALDDPLRPSILRSMLAGEEQGKRPSLLRMMLMQRDDRSIVDMLMQSGANKDSIARMMFTETLENPVSLCRSFFADTAMGKPSLAKYVFGGETEQHGSSLMRLMLQGEARGQCSLLRLLGLESKTGGAALISLLTANSPSSLLDIMLLGEDTAQETSLARLMLGTTFTIENGRIRMGKLLGDVGGAILSTPSSLSLEETESIERKMKRGMTIAKTCMLGEEDGGPGISVMRMLLLGEEKDGQSVLRLLLTGEQSGEVSPLRIVFTGFHAAFVGANAAMDELRGSGSAGNGDAEQNLLDLAMHPKQWISVLQNVAGSMASSIAETQAENMSWKESFDKLVALGKFQAKQQSVNWQKNLAFLYTAFARVKSMGPEFARVWKKRWLNIASEVRLTGERVSEGSRWKLVAPEIATLVEAVADQNWPMVFVNTAQLIKLVERLIGGKARESLGRNSGKLIRIVESFAPRWF